MKPKTETSEAAASGSHTPQVAGINTGDDAMATAEPEAGTSATSVPGTSGDADNVMKGSEEEEKEEETYVSVSDETGMLRI